MRVGGQRRLVIPPDSPTEAPAEALAFRPTPPWYSTSLSTRFNSRNAHAHTTSARHHRAVGLVAAAAIHAQITAIRFRRRVEKRGLAVEIRIVVRLPDTRGLRPADQDVNPSGWARVSFVRDSARRPPLRQRLARLPVSARPQQPAVRVRERRRRVPVRRSTTGSRAASSASTSTRSSRRTGCSTRCTASARMGNPATPNFIPPGFTPADVTYHNVITEWQATNPAANTFEGTRRELLRVAHIVDEPDAPDGQRRVQPDGQARRRRTTACSTRAAATLGFSNGGGPHAEQSRPDAAARLGDRRDPADRSAQPVGVEGHQGTGRLHDSAGQHVRRRRRSEDARRDLRLRLPQRAPPVVGHDRRDDVRARTSAWTTSKRSTSSATARTTAG